MAQSLSALGIYVGLALLIHLFLSIRVSMQRQSAGVSTGTTGEDSPLYRAQRAHALNTEYAPIALIGLVGIYLLSGSIYVLHVVGILLIVGRIAHSYGLSVSSGTSAGRAVGTLLTWLSILVSGLACLYYAFV